MACISSNEIVAKIIIRKTARLANYYNSKWFVLYVQIPSESTEKIPLDKQRYLINNFKLATELGGEVIKVKNKNISQAILEVSEKNRITTICIGKPHFSIIKSILSNTLFDKLLIKITGRDVDLVILS